MSSVSKAEQKALAIQQLVGKINEVAQQVTEVKNEEEQWRRFLQLLPLIEELRRKQRKVKETAASTADSERVYEEMTQWLIDNGVPASTLRDELQLAGRLGAEGGGVIARRDVKKGELLFKIPRKVMLSTPASDGDTPLAQFVRRDARLSHPTSKTTVLALQLLSEKHNHSSFWNSYIKTLPRTFNTCLHYSKKDLEALRGSPAFSTAYRIITTFAKQYCYVFSLFNAYSTIASETSVPPMNPALFTWDEFLWAASAVMTRQNSFPVKPGQEPEMLLIPAWDLCNHAPDGEITTTYHGDAETLECTAMRDFKKGEQVYIFYGPRSNADLLLHNSFVVENNPNDFLQLRVKLPIDAPAIKEKLTLLQHAGMRMDTQYKLYGDGIPADLLAYLRVEALTQEEATTAVASLDSAKAYDPHSVLSESNERAAIKLAMQKFQSALDAYPTTLADDKKQLETQQGLADKTRLIIRLRVLEKSLLQNTIALLARETGITPPTPAPSTASITTSTTPATTSATTATATTPSKNSRKKKNKNKKAAPATTQQPATTN